MSIEKLILLLLFILHSVSTYTKLFNKIVDYYEEFYLLIVLLRRLSLIKSIFVLSLINYYDIYFFLF
jgi:hypothetical protein